MQAKLVKKYGVFGGIRRDGTAAMEFMHTHAKFKTGLSAYEKLSTECIYAMAWYIRKKYFHCAKIESKRDEKFK